VALNCPVTVNPTLVESAAARSTDVGTFVIVVSDFRVISD